MTTEKQYKFKVDIWPLASQFTLVRPKVN